MAAPLKQRLLRLRGSWGIWRLRRRSRRWGCSIWDRFNAGSMAESRDGRGRAARCGSKSLQHAAKPSPRGQTFRSFGQECPWNRSTGTLWFTQITLPRAGGPRSMGLQCRGFGRVTNFTGLRWHAMLTGREASGPQTSSCLLRRPAERECRLQAKDGPLDSGCHHPGLSGTGCALPVQVKSSLYKNCGVLLGAGSWRLAANTFARFYILRVEPISSCVLTSNR